MVEVFLRNRKTLREDAHLAEKKLAVNSTARARKSRKRLFFKMQQKKEAYKKLPFWLAVRKKGLEPSRRCQH